MNESMDEQIRAFIEAKNRNIHVQDHEFKAYFRKEQYPLAAFLTAGNDLDVKTAIAFDSLTAKEPGNGALQRFLKALAAHTSGFDYVICKNIMNDKLSEHFLQKGWFQMRYHPRSVFLPRHKFEEVYR